MRLPCPRRSDRDGAAVPPDDVAIEEPQDRRLGGPLGEYSLSVPCAPWLWRASVSSDRPKRRTIGLRASVGSTEASESHLARVGVVGPTRATYCRISRDRIRKFR